MQKHLSARATLEPKVCEVTESNTDDNVDCQGKLEHNLVGSITFRTLCIYNSKKQRKNLHVWKIRRQNKEKSHPWERKPRKSSRKKKENKEK